MMNFSGITKITKTVGGFAAKNSPTILTSLSVAGLVATTVMGVKATPKALAILDELEEKSTYEGKEWPSKTDKVKATWKVYLPTALMGGATIACMIGANSINLRRNAALASLYSLSETALKEYQAKVVEKIGSDKAKEIKEEVIKERLRTDPASKQEIVRTGRGDTLCYDYMSGRYFWSSIEDVKAAINNINKTMRLDNEVSLNDFYSELSLERIGVGDLLKWYIDYGYVEAALSSQLSDDGRPCLVVDFDVEPRYTGRDF